MRKLLLPLLLIAAPALSGCAASIAASAVTAAVQAARKPADPNADPGPPALEACRARAAADGEVRIIDVERRSPTSAVVWGTVGAEGQRRSFECRYSGKITSFKLRAIPQGQ